MPGWEGGSTRAWRKIRAYVLRRDQYRCQLRIAGICKVRANCVHHLDGKALGDDPARCVASCTPCNLHVGDPNRARDPQTHAITARDPEPKQRTAW
jgi:5-methylcytosine-specific restriction endonuclease McrA